MIDLIERLRSRAWIRRQIPDRKSVKNNEPDRLADLLEESADEIERLRNGCICGEPLTPNTVHRRDNPCYVKEELSDDEIDLCAEETGMWCDGTPDAWDTEAVHNFAKAILKKASEK